MAYKSKSILFVIMLAFTGMIFSCDDTSVKDTSPAPEVVSRKIQQPVAKAAPKKEPSKTIPKIKPADSKPTAPKPAVETKPEKKQTLESQLADHYDAKGKIDPFKALIQEAPEPQKSADQKKPDRILTPLEKIELSQIRLVAIITMKNRRIAMVEEASGKGYEVGVGTYIGRRQGRITQINDSSIVVKEPVRDYLGKISERVQEIKIHKNDIEE